MVVLSDLSIGSLVKDVGSTAYGSPIIWKVIAKNHSGYPSNSVTLIADKIIDIAQFDAPEPTNTNAGRKTGGNNNWEFSNLRQWLNASGTGWYTPSHSVDSIGTKLSAKKGFLDYLTQDFVGAILPTDVQTKVGMLDGNTVKTTKDKIFAPSMTELGHAGTTGVEGVPYAVLNTDTSWRAAFVAKETFKANTVNDIAWLENGSFYYWMRTPMPSSALGQTVYRTNVTGTYANVYANSEAVGVRPVLNMKADTVITGVDADGVNLLGFTPVTDVDLNDYTITVIDTFTNTDVQGATFYDNVKLAIKEANTADVEYYIKSVMVDGVVKTSPTHTYNTLGTYTVVGTVKSKHTGFERSETFTFKIIETPVVTPIKPVEFIDYPANTSVVEGTVLFDQGNIRFKTQEGATIVASVINTNGQTPLILLSDSKSATLSVGTYKIEYMVTANNDPNNKLTGTFTFSIQLKPLDPDKMDIIVKDSLTNKVILNNMDFVQKVMPVYSFPSGQSSRVVLTSYNLRYQSSNVSFSFGQLLTNIGLYELVMVLSDSAFPNVTKTVTLPFTVSQLVTDLSTVDVTFYNTLEGSQVITNNKEYKEESVKVDWSETGFPSDVKVSSYKMEKDGLVIPFVKNNTVVSDYATYDVVLVLQNGRNETKEFRVRFKITEKIVDFEIDIIDDISNSKITEGRKFEDVRVLPNWIIPVETTIFYNLKHDGNNIPFVKGVTTLSDYGEYILTLNIEETSNPTNAKTVVRKFFIVPKKISLNKIKVAVYNLITDVEIKNNDVYRGISVKPIISLDNSDVSFDAFITFNGTRRPYAEQDDTDVCTANGNYIVEYVLYDKNFPEDTRSVTRSFKIVADTVNINDIQIIIKDRLTNSVLENGQIFRGASAQVQPTWVEDSRLTYTYTLRRNGTNVAGYQKEDILTEKGLYTITVIASDPNYPSNTLSKTVTFSIEDDINVNDPNALKEEAYLNGLPYIMGTPIKEPGNYNLMVVRKKDTNFKYSITEVNFTVVEPKEEQKPLIIVSPEFIPSIEDTITIRYPVYGTKNQYRIDNGAWRSYTNPFKVTDNCLITARYSNYDADYFVSTTKDVTNIDKMPPPPPEVTGFIDGVDTYLSVSPNVVYEYGIDYSATLNGRPYILGTPIFNEKEEVKVYTLIVVAKKRLNGLSSSVTIVFTLDSVPPDKPVFTGFAPFMVQEDARPDVVGNTGLPITRALERTVSPVSYTSQLNGKSFILGSYVDDPDTYVISATAVKHVNGLRSTSVSGFTILHQMPNPIGPLRFSIIPLIEDNKDIAVDGEMVVDRPSGHISIYDDGYLISKTRELEEMLDILDKRMIGIQNDLDNNEKRIENLEEMRKQLDRDMSAVDVRHNEIKTNIIQMRSIFNNIDFEDLSVLDGFEEELRIIGEKTSEIAERISTIDSDIGALPPRLLEYMKNLQMNSSLIGEAIWYKKNS